MLRKLLIAPLALLSLGLQAQTPSDAEVQAREAIVAAFVQWLAATNAGDLEAQTHFYPERMDAFYLWRDASREAVFEEKRRVFSRALAIDIRTEAPQIVVSPTADKARMYFRKAYRIRGEQLDREGEVLQELLWAKAPDGWKIVSERDLLVLD